MAIVNVNTQVSMSCFGFISVDSSIGTDGLGTCVGVILECQNKVFCGHMASNMQIPNQQSHLYQQGEQKAKNLLTQILQDPNLENIKAAHICSGQGDFSTRAIKSGFALALVNNNPQLYEGTCFYYLNNAVVGSNNTLKGQNTIDIPGDWDI